MSTATLPARKLSRVIEQNRRQLRMLEAAGIDAKDIGKVFNRAMPNTRPTGSAEVERMTLPDTPSGLEELMNDQKRMGEVIKNNQLGDVIQKYARMVAEKDRDIKRQVTEQVTATMQQFYAEHGFEQAGNSRPYVGQLPDGTPDNTSQYNRMGLYNRSAMGAAIDNEFENSADYFRTIWHNARRSADLQAKVSRMQNAFSSTVPSEGGFLIPETLRSELLRVSLETAIVRPRARVIPMETLRVPFPAIDSTTNNGSVYGGIIAYWTEESAALQDASPSFGRVVLDAKKLTAYTQVPNELIADSPTSFQALIDQIYPEALGWYEDDAFINGNGVGMPQGMLHSGNTALIDVALVAPQTASQIVWEQLIRMYARMLPSSLGRGIWLASPATFVELATMALSVGTGGSAVWLNNGVAGPPATILGRPLYFSEKIPHLGNLGDLNFVDPAYYLIGDRQVMSAMSSPHYRFQNDETAYRIISRVDGLPWLRSAISPKNGGDTLSPFVRRGVS